jgi:hypothetical protein
MNTHHATIRDAVTNAIRGEHTPSSLIDAVLKAVSPFVTPPSITTDNDREAFETISHALRVAMSKADSSASVERTYKPAFDALHHLEGAHAHCAPKVTEAEAVDVATKAIHGSALRGVITGQKPAMRDGVAHMVAALKAAGVRFKEEA